MAKNVDLITKVITMQAGEDYRRTYTEMSVNTVSVFVVFVNANSSITDQLQTCVQCAIQLW